MLHVLACFSFLEVVGLSHILEHLNLPFDKFSLFYFLSYLLFAEQDYYFHFHNHLKNINLNYDFQIPSSPIYSSFLP